MLHKWNEMVHSSSFLTVCGCLSRQSPLGLFKANKLLRAIVSSCWNNTKLHTDINDVKNGSSIYFGDYRQMKWSWSLPTFSSPNRMNGLRPSNCLLKGWGSDKTHMMQIQELILPLIYLNTWTVSCYPYCNTWWNRAIISVIKATCFFPLLGQDVKMLRYQSLSEVLQLRRKFML